MNYPRAALVWTRSSEDWAADQQLFSPDLPGELIHLPCLSLQAYRRRQEYAALEALLVKGGPIVAVFTSAWGVRFALAEETIKSLLPTVPIYALGEGTAAALAAAQLASYRPSLARNGEEFARFLMQKLPRDAAVLLPGGGERAYDLQGFLASKGFSTLRLDLYQTKRGVEANRQNNLARQRLHTLLGRVPVYVCFASPSAVEGFALGGVSAGEIARAGEMIVAVAIGETTARRCRSLFQRIEYAATPRISALCERAEALLNRQGLS